LNRILQSRLTLYAQCSGLISQGECHWRSRSQEKIIPKKTYHATMLVTRTEEWWVEAETAEEARRLLSSGDGDKCYVGDRIHVEVRDLLD
jgi:hypothetical protein